MFVENFSEGEAKSNQSFNNRVSERYGKSKPEVQEVEDVDDVEVKVCGHEKQLYEVEKGVSEFAEKD